MSLQLAAQHLSNQGRGPDDTLVHMSRDEVKSLNDLAMAHGGQLTINPHTGLPEAGFLSSLLPMVAGAALTGLSGGAINPLTASLLVGGGTMLMGGSLQKGLMAGLGAYGGGSRVVGNGTRRYRECLRVERAAWSLHIEMYRGICKCKCWDLCPQFSW